jgi:DNA processing protein
MLITEEQALILALCKIKGINWYLLAREVQRPGGLERLVRGQVTERSTEASRAEEALKINQGQLAALAASAQEDVKCAASVGARLITVADDDYPATLRLIFNLPPFLFIRGDITEEDLRSVAVVGTRKATATGQRRAEHMARLLVERDVTVVSGLARGIDTAAHRSALDAGGRTIAVIGTGITRCYPAANRELADEIARCGAVVSQFWPDAPGATYTFPRRNVTMSGIAQGTVVIEASNTSGAKMQARIALEHGKKVFLLRSLTEQQDWARKYVESRGATMVEDVEDVVRALAPADRIHAADFRRAQLAMQFG